MSIMSIMSIDERYDDAVVGAGILGLAHAYHLAKRGRRVVVFERSPRASGASIRNFGMLWPIGQPPGAMHEMAMRSRELWLEVLGASCIWHEKVGSLHLAYEEDEAAVLAEFAHTAPSAGFRCELLMPKQVSERSGAVRQTGLKAGLWSDTETCVDPRQVVRELPGWLEREWGIRFEFGCAVSEVGAAGRIVAGGKPWRVGNVIVCGGDDLHTLFPDVLEASGLTRCKLQMMRTKPLDGWRLGPMLAAGLTLRHYKSFAGCPTLPALQARFAAQMPEYDRYGIHVMASQNGLGELVLGDSHEYDADIEPFDKQEIDELVLSYLATFLHAPELHIASRWHGIYAKNPGGAYLVRHPVDGVTLVTGVGGAGMTLSFGLAEAVVNGML
jgi:D-hydroxyproline dehydrogenase subunit beta